MTTLAVLSLLAWIVLAFAHGRFWQAGPILAPAIPVHAPDVAIVVPARDEAAGVSAALSSLLAQDYPGRVRIVLVDDNSTDDTAAIAAALGDLTVIAGRPRPSGWAGKLWAVHQGVSQTDEPLLLLTDADIVHDPRHLSSLVAHLQATGVDLASEMVALRRQSWAERALIPAFVYFFAMLYPFSRVNDGQNPTAAAAGGTVLIRRAALDRIGGIEAISTALIDDVALAGRVKRGGRIWLGHSALARSVRPYPHAVDVWRMVARSAYVQLRLSPMRLILSTLGLALLFWVPPIGTLDGSWIAAAAWVLMALTFWPTLQRFGASPLWAPALPAIASFYMAATIGSATDHHLGRGVRVEKPRLWGGLMENVESWSGKDRGDENFPVGVIVSARLRPHVHAFYNFARNADDIADSDVLEAGDKIARLDVMEQVLLGSRQIGSPSGLGLRRSLAETGVTPQHAQDLLVAFRQDAVKHRYATWDELQDYCRWSAMPVGRHVLELHGESQASWPASDALCTVLQVLNHLQDGKKDLLALDRCYLPDDLMLAHATGVDDLLGPAETPGLRRVFDALLDRCDALNAAGVALPRHVRDRRLRIETGVITRLAHRLAARLRRGDPVATRVKLGKTDAAFAVLGALRHLA